MENTLHSHPYYPVGASIAGYSPNESSLIELLVKAGGGCTALLGLTFILVSYARPRLCLHDRMAILWFMLLTAIPYVAGTLHCFFEGYFMVNHREMASAQDLFGQLWKEYALSDSRYMTSETLVLCMETMTVDLKLELDESLQGWSDLSLYKQLLWGPLCFWVVTLIITQDSLRHPIQLLVCMSHLYGDTLYYATSLFDHYAHNISYSRPEGYYFWLYYFFMNLIWIVVPFCESRSKKATVCQGRRLNIEDEYTSRLSGSKYSNFVDSRSIPAGVCGPFQNPLEPRPG
ncbi:hypothetical protein N7539_002633 [Penicillium diatomitis]|uniref:EXPERA domain-containing protein n=1 Tax=Penicillium diatomitis TaxID=2819901 RepID=A0A9X0BYW0_9EURO|nr:uncharacterized protein N7539_002633 [Penicillium diatomitis]KAJ5491066.1 hypothetical protein N7539_002633 [Penicillium diatomitis]